jgi:ABC-type transporter Mla subunit MlaD
VRKAIPITIALMATACLCFFLVRKESKHRIMLYTYYRHAQEVQKGMPVCVDGVQLGFVSSVTVRPELGDHPIELVLTLNPPYDLKIPVGSVAQITATGILRPTIVDIDTRTAQGPPVANGSTIQSRESTDDQAAHALGVVVKALVDQSKTQQQKPSVPASSAR